MTMEELAQWDVGRYAIQVSKSSQSPTIRNQNFDKLLQTLKMLPDLQAYIDPLDILDLSDLPMKERLIAKAQQRQQQLQQQQMAAMAGGGNPAQLPAGAA